MSESSGEESIDLFHSRITLDVNLPNQWAEIEEDNSSVSSNFSSFNI